jgi:hypothetical protein
MAENVEYEVSQYKLRAASPMPIAGGGTGHFVLHTFKAEKSKVKMFTCTTVLPSTDDFRGQNGELASASFSRMNIAGGEYFQGKKVYNSDFVEEDELGFNF